MAIPSTLALIFLFAASIIFFYSNRRLYSELNKKTEELELVTNDLQQQLRVKMDALAAEKAISESEREKRQISRLRNEKLLSELKELQDTCGKWESEIAIQKQENEIWVQKVRELNEELNDESNLEEENYQCKENLEKANDNLSAQLSLNAQIKESVDILREENMQLNANREKELGEIKQLAIEINALKRTVEIQKQRIEKANEEAKMEINNNVAKEDGKETEKENVFKEINGKNILNKENKEVIIKTKEEAKLIVNNNIGEEEAGKETEKEIAVKEINDENALDKESKGEIRNIESPGKEIGKGDNDIVQEENK